MAAAVSPPPPRRRLERQLRVLVVDDLEVIHLGYRLMLCERDWVERCVAARSAEQAVALARRYAPHLAIVEAFVEAHPAAALVARLREAAPGLRVLLTSSTGWMSPASVRAAGAHGFVAKDASVEELAEAAHRVGSGCATFAPRIDRGEHVLTPRERSVLALIAAGSTNREIGEALHLSPHTVKEHASSMFRKLGARNRAEAVQRAQRLGLIA
jgi:two-component system response regulator DesR